MYLKAVQGETLQRKLAGALSGSVLLKLFSAVLSEDLGFFSAVNYPNTRANRRGTGGCHRGAQSKSKLGHYQVVLMHTDSCFSYSKLIGALTVGLFCVFCITAVYAQEETASNSVLD